LYMKPLLNPKLDFVFKRLFTEDTSILADLLNSVLKYGQGNLIKTVEVKNPIILPDEITQKFIILDILAQDEKRQQYDIEIQVRNYVSYPERALYYLCRLYSEQLDSGENYEKLKPVIGIHFLDYEQFCGYDDFCFYFEMIDERYPKLRLTKDLSLHIFELPKFEKILKSGWQGDKIKEWLHFFNHADKEDTAMRTEYKNPAIHNAFQILEMLSADEKTRHLAEVRERALKNEVSELSAAKEEGKKEGKEEGKEEEKLNMAKKLLSMGILTPEQISEATGLSGQEIKNLTSL